MAMNNLSKATIIMYHYVRDIQNSKYPAIKGLDISDFEQQIKFLKKNYTFISMEEFINSIENGNKLPNKSVLLTFDDAYIDHYEYVMPILMENNVFGAFYPSIKAITHHIVLDVNKIHFILASVNDKKQIVKTIFKMLDSLRSEYNLEANESYYKKFAKGNRFDSSDVVFIKKMLQVGLDEGLRKKIINVLFDAYVEIEETAFSKDLYMSTDHLKEMIIKGMHIGSHGFDHYWLNSLDYSSQEIEIKRSIDFLNFLGVDSEQYTICYPYGGYNENTIDILRKYNFKTAFTTKVDLASTSKENRFEVPRLDTNDIPKKELATPNEWYNKY